MEHTKDNTPRIVTFTGDLGSGKSVASKRLADYMGVDRYSAGDIQREASKNSRKTTLELNQDEFANSWLDQQIDGFLSDLSRSESGVIVDARLGWHFIPNSFRVKLLTKPEIAAERILGDTSRGEEKYANVQEAKEAIIERQNFEWERFKRKYEADFNDDANFDLIIDTSFASPDAVYQIVERSMEDFFQKRHFEKVWLSPMQLLPTENIIEKGEDTLMGWANDMHNKGYSDDYPVVAVKINGNHFLFDGHKRTFGAASADIPLIPVEICAPEDALRRAGWTLGDEVQTAYTPSKVYDWQDAIKYCRQKLGVETIADFNSSHRGMPTASVDRNANPPTRPQAF